MIPPDRSGLNVPGELPLPLGDRTHTSAQKQPYFVLLGIVGIVLVSINPLLARSSHVGMPEFHATLETVGALLGLVAGLAMISQFYALGNRFYLFVGLAFLVNGAEDIVHGLLCFETMQRLIRIPASDLTRFVPATYVAGRLLMGVLLLAAPFALSWFGESKRPKRETFRVSLAVILLTLLVTCSAYFVSLPRFIYPNAPFPRPVDLFSAAVFTAALVAMIRKYDRDGDALTWWVALSLLVNAAGQFTMSFSRSLYDPFFDMAHVDKVLGYAIPLLGFCLCQVGVIVDLSRAAAALRESEERYQLLFDSVDLGVAQMDATHTALAANAALGRMYRKTPGDFVGKPCYRVFRQRESICTDCPGVKAMATGRPAEAEVTGVRDDGSRFWCLLRAVPAIDAKGAPTGFIELVEDMSERKRMQDILVSERDFSNDLVNSLPGLFYLFDDQGRFLRWNRNFETVTGYSAEEIAGMHPLDIFVGTDRELMEGKMREVFVRGEADGEAELVSKSGEATPFYFKGVRTVVNGAPCLVGVAMDISARKRAEEGRERLAAMLEATPDFVAFASAKDQQVLYINPAGRKMIGLGPDEDVTKWKIPQAHPDWTNRLFAEEVIPTVIRDGVWKGECAFLHRDGREVPISMVLLSHKNPHGEVKFFSTISRDITELKQTEEALRASQSMYRALFDSSSDAIMLLTPEKGFLNGNPAAVALFGCRDEGEFTSHTPADLSPECQPDGVASSEKAQQMMADALREGSQFFEWIHRRTDGSEFPATVLLSRMELEGKVVLQATVRDITAQKRMEDELRKAKDAAEAATHAKSEFLANMSHEIRTPITAILGFADVLIEEHAAHPDWLEQLAIIKRNGEHLLQIINDILDVSRIEQGQLTVECVPCSPAQLVAGVQSLMEGRAAAKGLAFDVEQAGPIPNSIQTDPTRLRQILINLVGNAVKFTETGSVRLVMRFVDGKHPALQFDVLDTGIGMTAEQAAKAFQPFVQADLSTARRFGGSGLGLAISKRLAPMLGGDVELVQTAVGVGSRFRLTVPAGPVGGAGGEERPPAAPHVAVEKGAPSAAATLPPGCRILLAEDGADNQRLIAHLLGKAGAEVAVVENGQLAVDAVIAARDQRTPFHVILMDMQMPLLDGYEATRRLRAAGYAGPIIALTAHAMKEDRQKCLDSGCNDYLTKPIDRATLLAAVGVASETGAMQRR
ncbi:MAG: PAS domain S-box protein [Pirellulales bacterium]